MFHAMGIELFASYKEWKCIFPSGESEFQSRLLTLAPAEKQELRITHLEPENILTSYHFQQSKRLLYPSEALILDDVIYDETTQKLTLPFMPEYVSLAKTIDQEITVPHNSALTPFSTYGHFLHDQLSLEPLFDAHPQTKGLPLVLNTLGDTQLRGLLKSDWKKHHYLINQNRTRFKKLHLIIHRYQEIRRVQAQFLNQEYRPTLTTKVKQALQFIPSKKRLYIARTQRRRVINEKELCHLLKTYGFSRIEDRQLNQMRIAEQAAVFNSAKIILSPHGSHLANCFFCQPEVCLIELFKFSWIDASELSVLRSATAQAHYSYLVDWAPWETSSQTLAQADIRVDLDKLEHFLQSLT